MTASFLLLLLTATVVPVVADRPSVDAVYEAAEEREYSLRAAVEAIVAPPEFARK